MLDIKNNCIDIQKYIKKSKSTLEKFMYSPGGIAFIIMTPFVFMFIRDMFLRNEVVEMFTSIPFSAVAIFVSFVVVSGIFGAIWYFKKIKTLKESIQNLKEFEQELD